MLLRLGTARAFAPLLGRHRDIAPAAAALLITCNDNSKPKLSTPSMPPPTTFLSALRYFSSTSTSTSEEHGHGGDVSTDVGSGSTNGPINEDTNGMYLNYSMLYYDSVAFLVSNQLGIPIFLAKQDETTPSQVAQEFNLSVRAASAILVTLCRQGIVDVSTDSSESVDDIAYKLTSSAMKFLADQNNEAYFSPFADTLTEHFISPESLLECARPEEKKDIMSEHLERGDEDVNEGDDDGGVNARHFMRHMNAQSYSCAKAFPHASGLAATEEPATLLDVGGGSAVYGIEACKSNQFVNGIVFELPKVKPITEEYVEEAGLSERISVHAGDFFADPFPGPVEAVLFSNILHDWPDETNVDLMRKAYECLAPGGRILISELLLADDIKSSSVSSTCMNVIMLPFTKGRQYRPKELFTRLQNLGFSDPHVVHLVDDYDLVVATKQA